MALHLPGRIEVMQKLLDALGIAGPVKRLVIVSDVRESLTAYVVRYVHQEEVEPLIAALAGSDRPTVVECRGVEVDEKGRVAVDP